MKNSTDTLSTAGINFSCLLCLRRQKLQKIYTSSVVALLGYVDYICKSVIVLANLSRYLLIARFLLTSLLSLLALLAQHPQIPFRSFATLYFVPLPVALLSQ